MNSNDLSYSVFLKSLLAAFAIILFLMAVVGLVYWSGTPSFKNQLGPFGDMVGGLLNPLLASITIAGLIFTIVQQQKTMRIQQDELRTSNETLKAQQKIADQQLQHFRNEMLAQNNLKAYDDVIDSLEEFCESSLQLHFQNQGKRWQWEKIWSAFTLEKPAESNLDSAGETIRDIAEEYPYALITMTYRDNFQSFLKKSDALYFATKSIMKAMADDPIVRVYVSRALKVLRLSLSISQYMLVSLDSAENKINQGLLDADTIKEFQHVKSRSYSFLTVVVGALSEFERDAKSFLESENYYI